MLKSLKLLFFLTHQSPLRHFRRFVIKEHVTLTQVIYTCSEVYNQKLILGILLKSGSHQDFLCSEFCISVFPPLLLILSLPELYPPPLTHVISLVYGGKQTHEKRHHMCLALSYSLKKSLYPLH